MVPRIAMYNNLQEYAVKGIHEETGLSVILFFLFKGNIALLQSAIQI